MPELFKREALETWQDPDNPDFCQRLREQTLDLLESG
jgi:hypothetical protein